jgi:TRAP-type transport system periplasmic protein
LSEEEKSMCEGRTRSGAALFILAAALFAVSTACGSSGSDKAGGSSAGRPVALTLATHDRFAAVEFVKAVERLSSGSIQVEVRPLEHQGNVFDYETTVEGVRAGRVDLVLVPAGAWDTMGVTSFRALVAPFLVDSLALQRRVLESPLLPRMLEGVESLGLVGIAVLPGPLRRPLGATRALLGPGDYEGATIGIGPGGVTHATFRALGATPKEFDFGGAYDPTSIAGLDGLELDLRTVFNQGYLTSGSVSALTANVVFWPQAQTISINRRSFDALRPGQQTVLRRAGREAIAPESDLIATVYENEPLASGCRPGMLPFATAAQTDLAALREAVGSVYNELERDPLTRHLIAEIRAMRREMPSKPGQSLRCPRANLSARTDVSELDGLWRARLSREELLAAGMSRQDVDQCTCSTMTIELEKGHWLDAREGKYIATGRFTLDGNVLRVNGLGCSPDPCAPFTEEYTWSRYRDTLSLARIPGRRFTPLLIADSFTRGR